MFKNSKAFGSFSVNDLKKAKDFYGRTLGLEVSESPEGLDLQIGGGNHVFIYPKPNHTPASFTILNFPVRSINETIDMLMRSGVRFEHYDNAIKTDDKGIFRDGDMQIAWFKDPSGNILSVIQDG
jgi:catechol 2,3-dioxygenase-like lactoylglutathione lyase family enzyme